MCLPGNSAVVDNADLIQPRASVNHVGREGWLEPVDNATEQDSKIASVATDNVTGKIPGAFHEEDLDGRKNGGLNECIADELLQIVKDKGLNSVADYGAGNGIYSWYIHNRSDASVKCFDGNEVIEKVSKGLCQRMDLGSLQNETSKSDLVFSLEVGEHIPATSEGNFLQNLRDGAGKYLILSWAIPGQHGNGHVNCQTNEDITRKVEQLGMSADRELTEKLRKRASVCPEQPNSGHFVHTIMAFTSRTGAL